jgi:hypothetical protein
MTDPEPALQRSDGVRQTIISSENQEAISKFLKSSVLPSTDRKYELQWGWFVQFMKDQGSDDPFMKTLTPQERAGMVSLFMMSRHIAGKRGKAASAVTAQFACVSLRRWRTRRSWIRRSCHQHGLLASPIPRSYANGAAARQ